MARVEFTHIMDASGSHELVAPDGTRSRKSSYDSPAILDWKGKTYLFFTAYYDGCLPIETVLEIANTGNKCRMFDNSIGTMEEVSNG